MQLRNGDERMEIEHQISTMPQLLGLCVGEVFIFESKIIIEVKLMPQNTQQ